MTQRIGVPVDPRTIDGQVVAGFRAKLSHLMSKNEGVRQFNVYQTYCYNDSAPFTVSDVEEHYTYLPITSDKNDVSQLDKTFVTFKMRAKVRLNENICTYNTLNLNDNEPNTIEHASDFHIFLGWKDANEMFKVLQVYNANVDSGYQQRECAKEGFAYSLYVPEEQKQNELYSHSRWDDVVNGRRGVCGGYYKINGKDETYTVKEEGIKAQEAVERPGIPEDQPQVTMKPFDKHDEWHLKSTEFWVEDLTAVLHINQLLPLQAFEAWPGGLGDVTLKFIINKDSMVWAVVDPMASYMNDVSRTVPNFTRKGYKEYNQGEEIPYAYINDLTTFPDILQKTLNYKLDSKANDIKASWEGVNPPNITIKAAYNAPAGEGDPPTIDAKVDTFTWPATPPKVAANTEASLQLGAYHGFFYERTFTQVGSEGPMIVDYSNAIIGPRVLDVVELEVQSIKCDCYGFNVTQDVKRALYNMFTPTRPYIIPAQELEVVPFQIVPRADLGGSYITDISYPLHNVTDFILVFPKQGTDVTVFKNPNIQNVQLRVNNVRYPEEPFENTWDYRFFNFQIQSADIESYFAANQDYIRSLLYKREYTDTTTPYDISNFAITIQTERNNDGFFFDGLETGTENVNIQLRFNWQTGDNALVLSEIAPEMWLVRDTYWTVDRENGLRYWKTGTPQKYASEEEMYAAQTFF